MQRFILFLSVSAVMCLLCRSFAGVRNSRIFLFFIYINLYFCIALIASPIFSGHGVSNWLGRLLCICVSLIFFRVAGLSRNEIGFALPVGWRAYFWSIGGVVLSILYSSAETLLLHAVSNSSGEALIYQATMPGLDEELCFRGVGFAILSSAFCSKYEKISQWFMPSCIVSILFFVAHMNPDFSNVLSISFYVPVQILIPTLILMWIRLQTKSLFGSILAHNATNLTPMIISMA